MGSASLYATACDHWLRKSYRTVFGIMFVPRMGAAMAWNLEPDRADYQLALRVAEARAEIERQLALLSAKRS